MSITSEVELEVLKILTNKRMLLIFFRRIPINSVSDIVKNINTVFNQVKNDNELKINEQKEKLAKLKELVRDSGITLDDLIKIPEEGRLKIEDRKYQYISEYGIKKYWSGRGRMPKIIKDGLISGKKLDDFLIKL